MNSKAIKNWSADERPREKLQAHGAQALSNAELLAILLGSGSRKMSAVDLARAILHDAGQSLDTLGRRSLAEFNKYHGMGNAKSLTLMAALELGRRRRAEETIQKPSISSSRDAYEYFLKHLGDLSHEEFWVMLLTRKHVVIDLKKVSEGGLTATVVDPKKVFLAAIEHKASAIIVAHNHPSGSLEPSHEDVKLTKRLSDSGKLLDLPLLDHVIIGMNNYYSFADNGTLT